MFAIAAAILGISTGLMAPWATKLKSTEIWATGLHSFFHSLALDCHGPVTGILWHPSHGACPADAGCQAHIGISHFHIKKIQWNGQLYIHPLLWIAFHTTAINKVWTDNLLLMQQSHHDDTNGHNFMYQEDISYVSPFVFLSHSVTKAYFIDTWMTKGIFL